LTPRPSLEYPAGMASDTAAELVEAKERPKGETPSARLHDAQTLLLRAEELFEISGTAALARLLGGRWSYWRVRDWRRGHNYPPREAMEYLASVLRERMARYEILAAACARAELGCHAPNIKSWNARRAAEGR